MSITLVKQNGQIRLVSSSVPIPEGVPIVFFTKEEILDPWEKAELDSIFSDHEDWGVSLDKLVVCEQEEQCP